MSKLNFFYQVSKFLFGLYLVCFAWGAPGQERTEISDRDYQNESVEMADRFREEGKIYVVVAVILTIFVGIVLFLFVTERKINTLEQQVKQLKENKYQES